jgi:hypothetical protein
MDFQTRHAEQRRLGGGHSPRAVPHGGYGRPMSRATRPSRHGCSPLWSYLLPGALDKLDPRVLQNPGRAPGATECNQAVIIAGQRKPRLSTNGRHSTQVENRTNALSGMGRGIASKPMTLELTSRRWGQQGSLGRWRSRPASSSPWQDC